MPETIVEHAQNIRNALLTLKKEEARKACEAMAKALKDSGSDFSIQEAENLADELKKRRYFDLLDTVCEAFTRASIVSHKIRRLHAQAHIEMGNYGSAQKILNTIIDNLNPKDFERTEAEGLLGRLFKQKYVNGSKDLQESFSYYYNTYNRDTKNTYHAVNVLAIASLAQKNNVQLPVDLDIHTISNDVITEINKNPQIDEWGYASIGEAALAKGDFNLALKSYQEFANNKNVNAFSLASAIRQLKEIWQFDPNNENHNKILMSLNAQLLMKSGGELEISSNEIINQRNFIENKKNDTEYQRVLGDANFVTLTWLRKGLMLCSHIARIGRNEERGEGTGFLLKGEELHEKWTGKMLVITNFHVCNNEGIDNAIHPNDAIISFQVWDKKKVKVIKTLWQSPKNELDVIILEVEIEFLAEEYCIVVARNLPQVQPDQRTYIIGHPSGGSLSLSIQDNELINIKDSFIHYLTPTEGGHSGSPIFNNDWKLIGVHHAYNSKVQITENSFKEANEGISWFAIREKIASDLQIS